MLILLESTSEELAKVQHVACQTDTPQLCTVGSQLSIKTLRPHYKSTATQTTTLWPDIGVVSSQPLLSSTPIKRPNKRSRLEQEEEEDPFGDSSSVNVEEPMDSTYDPADSVTTLTEPTDVTMESSQPAYKTATYIVYENCLLQLFEQCPVCHRVTDVQRRTAGTFLAVEQRCPHLYASGASFFKLQKIFRAMQLKLIHYDTFRSHAQRYTEPAIVHSWKTAQDGMLQQLSQEQNIVLGGDLRADSPGHSAKYGSYSVMDLRTSSITDVQLVQSNEVGGSNNMAKEGLKRSLDLLRGHGVTFDSIVTDRHPQVQKFLREANITQYFDVWHIEKGTPAFCRLEKVLTNKRILKDVEKLSPHHQTSSLEAFHSVILRFAPRSVVFSFLGRELCSYASHHTGGQHHPDPLAQKAPTPADEAPVGQKPVTTET
ncbi:Chaperone protein DnaJ [Labeo rohita]|uniref:Chaperone protein DnaJ n=1 Tax=Labeo rohita TaxID=84645 RepID=A0ABQ8MMJ6_LABRO|nr:Chaperone protein DnaJ [Labeo rohita]